MCVQCTINFEWRAGMDPTILFINTNWYTISLYNREGNPFSGKWFVNLFRFFFGLRHQINPTAKHTYIPTCQDTVLYDMIWYICTSYIHTYICSVCVLLCRYILTVLVARRGYRLHAWLWCLLRYTYIRSWVLMFGPACLGLVGRHHCALLLPCDKITLIFCRLLRV